MTIKKKSKRAIKSSAINYFRDNVTGVFNYKQVAAKLQLHSHQERGMLQEVMEELVNEKFIVQDEPGKYRAVVKSGFVVGTVDMTKQGAAFILVEGMENDVFIQPAKTGGALHGDTVKVLLHARRKSSRPEGEIVEVVRRARTSFTGVLQLSKGFGFLIADSSRMNTDIFIPARNLHGAKDGEKVLVEITEWPAKMKSPTGKVVKILGMPGEHHAEMNSIILEYNLPEEFPVKVEKESQKIKDEITEREVEKRWDFRGIPTFTIDPFDAKDFDDAISVRSTGKGLWEIGVHIADVTHYVHSDTALDKEALERATSVYLVDRVIPMLPEKLSNELCSLRPDEDKLCFSVVVVMDEKAEIKKEWFGKTIIRSLKRFTYEDAQQIIETGEGTYKEEILLLNKLALKLREKKFAEGAISFETEEVKFRLDENGVPVEVVKKVRKDAHKLIEDFMLLANRKVAEYVYKKSKNPNDYPFVYRVHERPNEEKLNAFCKAAASFGYRVDTKDDKTLACSLNVLLQKIEGRPEQNFLQSLAIRSMAKAVYTTHKSNHYGLAFEHYTHFTSPIRRYPDVLVHRLLAQYLSGKKGADKTTLEEDCDHCSLMEIKANDAERASIKFKQTEYMSKHIGKVYDGVISGTTDWGIYVEIIENKCEGMVRLSSMRDDTYIYDEERFLLRGYQGGKTYRLGDLVKVKVSAVNLTQRTTDFEFV